MIQLHHGDCLDVLRTMPDASVDAIVTDPPYGLRFMGKKWDYDVPTTEVWAECLRVLKPGGHLLAFAGTRTQHRMAVRIEDAGFEIRDMIAWVYGSGFPKSMDVSKAIDKMDAVEEQRARRFRFTEWVRSTGIIAAQIDVLTGTRMGHHYTTHPTQPSIMTREHLEACRMFLGDIPEWVERECDIRSVESRNMAAREVVGVETLPDTSVVRAGFVGMTAPNGVIPKRPVNITTPATDAARQWQGWGTALKPSFETVTWATKPFPPERERAKILGNLWKIEARLWLLSSASAAAQSSTSSQSEYGAACATAQWTADDATSTRAALRGLMDTWQCEMATHTSLSIVSSWRRTLEESSKPGSTFTTETESSTTTDWKTLSCCLSEITPESIIQACSLPGGFNANASTAAQIFNASLALLQSTLTLSAIEPATWQELGARQGEDVRPSLDPVIMARKPLEGTVAANVLQWGTGGINVDGCRVACDPADLGDPARFQVARKGADSWDRQDKGMFDAGRAGGWANGAPSGRWPANLIHSGEDEVVGLFPGAGKESAARFFYTAKADATDRNDGLSPGERNAHPTVKPVDLMCHLCRLVTPPGGIVLDPFMGSGSTGKACVTEGFSFIGIERDADSFATAQARVVSPMPLFKDVL